MTLYSRGKHQEIFVCLVQLTTAAPVGITNLFGPSEPQQEKSTFLFTCSTKYLLHWSHCRKKGKIPDSPSGALLLTVPVHASQGSSEHKIQ